MGVRFKGFRKAGDPSSSEVIGAYVQMAYDLANRRILQDFRARLIHASLRESTPLLGPSLALASLVGMLNEIAPGVGNAVRVFEQEGAALDMALHQAQVPTDPAEALSPAWRDVIDLPKVQKQSQSCELRQ